MREKYNNSEPLRECPYCPNSEEFPGRGLYNHVNLKAEPNGPHGPAGTVPEGFHVQDCRITGQTNVRMNRRSDYQQDHNRYVCQFCGTTTKGKSGLGVHLKNKVSKPLHDDEELKEQVEEGSIDYSVHGLFPATPDGRILVPSENHLSEIKLSKEEREDGFTVEVDEELEPIGEVVSVAPGRHDHATRPPDDEVLEEVKLRFKKHLDRGEDIDPVTAYAEVKQAFETVESNHTPTGSF